MTSRESSSRFDARVLRPKQPDGGTPWAFVHTPVAASARLPRRGRTTVTGTIDGHRFQATLEPDGQLSHWIPITEALLEAAGVEVGDSAAFEIVAMKLEPEPEVPADLLEALSMSPEARATWDDTTTIARLDWVHWVTSARRPATRTKRIVDALDMLSAGKRRVCCFDPSGHYSKAFGAPEADR